ncbi:unnamed protein product, partial [Acanthoscelides obtectus]
DSLSSLQTISDKFSKNPLVQEILLTTYQLQQKKSQVIYVWTPAHVGIHGNEIADTAAKEATMEEYLNIPVVPEDVKKFMRLQLLNEWQQEWNSTNHFLKTIKPNVTKWNLPHLTRREQVVITRMRIGHTILTHSHILLGNPPPRCETCNELLTWKHILIECPSYIAARRAHNIAGDLKGCLSSNANVGDTLNFLKSTKLFRKV